MGKYNIGEIWWTHFPFNDADDEKHRPAIVIDDNTIAVLTMYVTSQKKNNPFDIEITDWKEAGLSVPSWARIDRIISIAEWRMGSKIGDLTQKDLTKLLQLVAEIQTNTFHEFSLIAIKNTDNKYLQLYDERWDCWLFPYFRSTDNNRENVDSKISEQLGMDISCEYITVANHCKYSVSDDVYKIYHHKLYRYVMNDIPDNMNSNQFEIDGKKYKWMSINDMENDSLIMEKNDDIVAFVKTYC